MQQLSAQDASFIYTETPNAPMHVASINIYDPSTAPGHLVTFKGILAMIEARLHLAPLMRRRLVRVPMDLDHPYWVEDPEFDLEFHVRHIALPKPGDWRQFMIQCARLMARPLDLNRPLWEVYVIEGLDGIKELPAGSFAFLLKIHHAAVDGVSGVELITAIHDLEPGGHPAAATETWTPEAIPPPWELMARASVNNAMTPLRMAQSFVQSLPEMARRAAAPAATAAPAPSSPAPRTRFNGKVTGHRVIVATHFPLADFKRGKTIVAGATVNDTVLTVVGGAVRRYLEAKGELPTESLVTMVPVSVRSEGDAAAGNQVSAMAVSLATQLGDTVERLAAVHRAAMESKTMLEAVGARNLQQMSQMIPGALVGAAARMNAEFGLTDQTQPLFNFVTTNVPGPPVPLYSMGARLVASYGMGPIQNGMGVIFAIMSYTDALTITITACREMVPDPEFFADCIRASHGDLVRALGGSTDPVAAPEAPVAPFAEPEAPKPTTATPSAKKATVPPRATARKAGPKR